MSYADYKAKLKQLQDVVWKAQEAYRNFEKLWPETETDAKKARMAKSWADYHELVALSSRPDRRG